MGSIIWRERVTIRVRVSIFGSAWKAGKRVSAISGWAITLLAIACSVAPTAEVTNVWLFEAKLAAGTAADSSAGARGAASPAFAPLRRGARRRQGCRCPAA